MSAPSRSASSAHQTPTLCPQRSEVTVEDRRTTHESGRSPASFAGLALAALVGVLTFLLATADGRQGGLGPPPSRDDEDDPPATFTNKLGMEFVRVPKGTFLMGGGTGVEQRYGEKRIAPQEKEVDYDYYIGKYEVTQEEWEAVTGGNPSEYSRNGEEKAAAQRFDDDDLKRFPVENVSYEDAEDFVADLNRRTKEMGWKYRLPSEVEWEYACRGGPTSTRSYHRFDYYLATAANALPSYAANHYHSDEYHEGKLVRHLNMPTLVGSYEANKLGLYDMHGNVAEWCNDKRTDDSAKTNSTYRCVRGGGFRSKSKFCRAGSKAWWDAASRSSDVGLRLVRVPANKE